MAISTWNKRSSPHVRRDVAEEVALELKWTKGDDTSEDSLGTSVSYTPLLPYTSLLRSWYITISCISRWQRTHFSISWFSLPHGIISSLCTIIKSIEEVDNLQWKLKSDQSNHSNYHWYALWYNSLVYQQYFI